MVESYLERGGDAATLRPKTRLLHERLQGEGGRGPDEVKLLLLLLHSLIG